MPELGGENRGTATLVAPRPVPAARRHPRGSGANDDNGLHRSHADKRRAVEIALREFPKLSSRAIAEMCGVGDDLVLAIRPGQVPENGTSKVIGSDGKTYPAHRPARAPRAAGAASRIRGRTCRRGQ